MLRDKLAALLECPPLSAMAFTREPILHRFWGSGLLAAALGFGLGLLLWLQVSGLLVWEGFLDSRALHARVQILFFAGPFLLGFALQAGPHVLGSPPPPSRGVLAALFPLWFGFFLTLLPNPAVGVVGNVLVTSAYLLAGYYLARMVQHAAPERRPAIAWPLGMSIAPFAIAPWVPLEQHGVALTVLLCGPVTAALAASQQLIGNVLGGRRLTGKLGWLFFALLVAGWGAALLATTGHGSWRLAALVWLACGLVLGLGSSLYTVAWRSLGDPVVPTLHIGLSLLPITALLLLWQGDAALDAAIHLLGIGVVATLIIGVSLRVSSFFSGGYALPPLLTRLLLWLWLLVALLRAGVSLGWLAPGWGSGLGVALAALVLLPWLVGVANRLLRLQWPPQGK